MGHLINLFKHQLHSKHGEMVKSPECSGHSAPSQDQSYHQAPGGEGDSRVSGWLLRLFLLSPAKQQWAQGSCRVSARMRLWHLLGSCPPPEAQIKFIAVLCAAFLPPCIPRSVLRLLWPSLLIHPSHCGRWPPGQARPPSTPLVLPQILTPYLTCSGSLFPARIWEENEVIHVMKTNCLSSVRIHCWGRMDWVRCFVRPKAGGMLLSQPGNVIRAPQSSFWRDFSG